MPNEYIINASVSVGTSNVELFKELLIGQVNAQSFVNTSTGGQIITLAWDADAIAGAGVVLYPGASWSESKDSTFIPSNKRISAIADGASASLAIHRRVI